MKLLKLTDKFDSGKFNGKTVKFVIDSGQAKYLNYFLSRNKDYRLHKDAIKLAQTKTVLNLNALLVSTLTSINSDVSKNLLKLNDGLISTIFTNVKAYKRKSDTVVFDIPYGNKGVEIKIGRFVRKLFQLNKIEFKDSDVEQFVTDYFGAINGDNDFRFEVVNGEKIREYYHENKYDKRTGSLGKSCMRYGDYQHRFDLYAHNPEVSMLVLFNKSNDRVAGRAILWKKSKIKYKVNANPKEVKEFEGVFMDRIYVNNSKHTSLFKKYAEKEGFAYKTRQSYSSTKGFVIDGKSGRGRIDVTVKDTDVRRPYLDTLKYINNEKVLTNGARV